ncbi:MAG: hypothetical protein F4X72_07465, partial [Dehalococcoidia bacterium]|nr:hypothetical protein [Dehalococcoidia bacterium]
MVDIETISNLSALMLNRPSTGSGRTCSLLPTPYLELDDEYFEIDSCQSEIRLTPEWNRRYDSCMKIDIAGNPDYGQIWVELGPGEQFIAEGGSMAWMDSGIQSKARLLGGFLSALIRKFTGGESLFVGEYSSDTGGKIAFSPAQPGSVMQRTLNGDSFMLTGGSFMACTPGVELSTKFGGGRA